jgi:hypothetical protein
VGGPHTASMNTHNQFFAAAFSVAFVGGGARSDLAAPQLGGISSLPFGAAISDVRAGNSKGVAPNPNAIGCAMLLRV